MADFVEMKNRKVHNSNGPIRGCLGRMVNLLDINPGMAGNKRLMDKPQHYGGVFFISLISIMVCGFGLLAYSLMVKRLCGFFYRTIDRLTYVIYSRNELSPFVRICIKQD